MFKDTGNIPESFTFRLFQDARLQKSLSAGRDGCYYQNLRMAGMMNAGKGRNFQADK